MDYKEKDSIIQSGDELVASLEQTSSNLLILRSYNNWYTKALEFVYTHAEKRVDEFIDIHKKNQNLLALSSKHRYITS